MTEITPGDILPILLGFGVFIVCYYNCCNDRRENYMRRYQNPRLLIESSDEDRMEEGNQGNDYISYQSPMYAQPSHIIGGDELPKYDDVINNTVPNNENIPNDVFVPINTEPSPINTEPPPNYIETPVNTELPPINTELPPNYTEC